MQAKASTTWRGSALAGLLALGLGGCVVAPAAAPYPPVPPPRAEIIPKPPVTEEALIWQPGHWDWTGQGYVWTPGNYVPRAGHGVTWQEGSWAQGGPNGGQYVWIPAHWI